MMRLGILLAFCAFIFVKGNSNNTNEEEAWDFFVQYGKDAEKLSNNGSRISWAYNTNLTDENKKATVDFSKVTKVKTLEIADKVSEFAWKNFQNSTLKKVFKELADKGSSALDNEEFEEYQIVLADLEGLYGKAVVCDEKGRRYNLEPDLHEILTSSRDYERLLWVWKGWRDATGPIMKKKYERYVELANKAAKANGYSDNGDNWRSGYDVPGFEFRPTLERLYNELKPLYEQLHTYVRFKLKETFGKDRFPDSGHIPAHITGNMWAQQWNNIEELVLPFGKDTVPVVNATPALQSKTVKQMFELSDNFFADLGLIRATPEFWNRSMLVKPEDGREVVCHASAWDFNDGKDFRIKQCTRKTMEDFITVHHEMGHIQYYLQYKDLHYHFRGGANPGFHEAVGDVLALSVATPKHLKDVNLISDYTPSNESDINFLMSMALDKIVFLPFGKLMDDYRWAIFDGTTKPEDYNKNWWKLRCKYQGLSMPVERDDLNDFDAGAKYHIPANVPYVRYFVSFVLQFQFHEALCKAAGQTGPLHKCDISGSKDAGTLLGNMLKLGASKEWPDALEAVTGTRNISSVSILQYFQPLLTWLTEENKRNGETVGWQETCPPAPKLSVKSGSCSKLTSATIRAQPALSMAVLSLLSILLYR